ncbi:folylpolyglutamate synthase/dihydrofolate synthase family protein [Streptococcus sp. HMSC078H12]|uniref:bifunctional folylpolyglutamate synthase/dihydrofolate synthase n=1 Tax=Streptococcus sp. HMSC078H12 TaxID=1739483 RepID=UPI0008A40B52|nr:folylpolyglutamate synthase/dihydrofolate synthase family protein [Streptococcus sp. HMSC078H12]OFP61040.1 dihydrofolate synthase [Streptococcus sp. HMSC078H12]
MNYTETLNFIHSFKGNGRRPQLERMRWLLKQAGDPQSHYPTVHIVGTNGKGSTTSYLQNILTKSGYQVGTFTSPYITRFNERISINGTEIPDKDLISLVAKAQVLLNDLEEHTDFDRPTEFELVTLLMFLYFDLKQVDMAIIEAGIGGRLDSTNVLSPELVICTSIGFDHTETLGDSLLDIANHKAGVMRENTPILLGRVSTEVEHFFNQKSHDLQAPLAIIDREIQLLSKDDQTIQISYDHWESPNLKLPMLGQHQENNAGLAVTAAHLLAQTFPKITDKSIQEGIEETHWPGRSEWIGNNIYLDGAHNPQGIASLKQVLKDNFANRRVHILFAGLRRKPLADLLEELKDYDITVTSFDFFEALPLDDYPKDFKRVADYRDWLAQAESANSDDLFVVTGSLYFISAVRNYLIK